MWNIFHLEKHTVTNAQLKWWGLSWAQPHVDITILIVLEIHADVYRGSACSLPALKLCFLVFTVHIVNISVIHCSRKVNGKKKMAASQLCINILPAVQSFPRFPPHRFRWLSAWHIWRISLLACQHPHSHDKLYTRHIRCQKYWSYQVCVIQRENVPFFLSSLFVTDNNL